MSYFKIILVNLASMLALSPPPCTTLADPLQTFEPFPAPPFEVMSITNLLKLNIYIF
jgi:hypothetical protein